MTTKIRVKLSRGVPRENFLMCDHIMRLGAQGTISLVFSTGLNGIVVGYHSNPSLPVVEICVCDSIC